VRSGNPAKRAQQAAAAGERRTQAPPAPGELPPAFGGGGETDFELPDDIAEFLKKR
jgi:hypothetical protein